MHHKGPPYFKHELEMRQLITQTGKTKDHEATVYQLLAMGLLWAEDFDGAFASDRGFSYEVVNVFLKGSSAWQRKTLGKNGKLSQFRKRTASLPYKSIGAEHLSYECRFTKVLCSQCPTAP